METKITVTEVITNRIIELLEQGVVPWRKPWAGGEPTNLISKAEYKGINNMLLSCTGYCSSYFLSYKQAKDLGGNVKVGEKGYPIIYYKMLKTEEEGTEKSFPMIRYSTVFNIMQCEGITIPTPEINRPFNPIEECEKVLAGYPNKPELRTGSKACYMPFADRIDMPAKELFVSEEEYYSTLFHEAGHSTGNEKRLNRFGNDSGSLSFGSPSYAKEELVAEMTASFLCAKTGIDNQVINNQASYIASWLKILRGDSKLVISAASKAQKAADHITGI
jgi:antirestriction protein ArdC